MGLDEVSSILWRERNLLELLLFKLEEERLVAEAGLGRWLPRATREVELVLGELQLIEEPKGRALDAVALELGLAAGPSLDELVAAAPPPWDGLLGRHREAIAMAVLQIGPLELIHRNLLGRRTTDDAVAWLEGSGPEWRVRASSGSGDAVTGLRLLPGWAEPSRAGAQLSHDPTK